MALQRLDHISIVVRDLEAAIDFFVELGLNVDGRSPISGDWVDTVVGIPGLRAEIAMMRTPDGSGIIELTRFDEPAAVETTPSPDTPQALGLRSIMFAVTDVDATVDRMSAVGGELIGSIARYEDQYRLCYLRGPEGIIVALAEELTPQA
ncbi:VOC family protein [Leucobacter musarum]|uniref:VOC family protein n=1 Tax=Leucobacter musarum TaxID=1930747 RepID=UPI000A526E51|nr:VOC family protein [Leucobacter musarum]